MIKKNVDYKVKGYTNRWSVIAQYKGYRLLENCTWGDETCYLVVRYNAKVEDKEYTKKSTGEKVTIPTIMEVVCETFDDIVTALEDEGII